MFEIVMEAIKDVVPALIGDTGYLDQAPWSKPVKGLDRHGRPFFSLPIHVIETNCYGQEEFVNEKRGMVTFFKRYSNEDQPWVTGESHIAGDGASPVLNGAIGNPDNGDVEDLILRLVKGETVDFEYRKGMMGSSYFLRKARLLSTDVFAECAKKPPELP